MTDTIVVNRLRNSPYDPKFGTFGYIDVLGLRIRTIEKEWVTDPVRWPSGKPNESCIPAGEYSIVERYSNKKKKNMFYLVNESLGIYLYDGPKESDRGSCMFHKASRSSHVEGCVGLGVNVVDSGGTPVLDKIDTAELFLYEYIKTFKIKKCSIVYR